MRLIRGSALILAGLLSGSLSMSVGHAQSKPAEPFSGYELRLAGLSHNIEPGGDEHGSVNLGGSILLPKADAAIAGLSSVWIPRLHVGGTGNFEGKTSFAYAGVTWTVPLAQVYYISVDFGGAVNDGEPLGITGERVAMGCHATFREAAAFGRSITDAISIAATIEHFSNANLCDRNSGITNFGLMLGYQF